MQISYNTNRMLFKFDGLPTFEDIYTKQEKKSAIFCLPKDYGKNHIQLVKEIYDFLYGKSPEEVFKYDKNIRSCDPFNTSKNWTYEKVMQMDWNMFLASLYTFFLSKNNFSCMQWEKLTDILLILKKLNSNELNIIFKSQELINDFQSLFWNLLEHLISEKYIKNSEEDIRDIYLLKKITPVISENRKILLEKFAFEKYKTYFNEEFENMHSDSRSINNFFVHFQDVSHDIISILSQEDILIDTRRYIDFIICKLVNVSTKLNFYELTHNICLYGMFVSCRKTNFFQLSDINKKMCKFIPKNKVKKYRNAEKEFLRRYRHKYNYIEFENNTLKISENHKTKVVFPPYKKLLLLLITITMLFALYIPISINIDIAKAEEKILFMSKVKDCKIEITYNDAYIYPKPYANKKFRHEDLEHMRQIVRNQNILFVNNIYVVNK